MQLDKDSVFEEYNRLIDHCSRVDAPEQFLQKLAEMRDVVWEDYARLLANVGVDWRGATVLDYGCKYGQMFPLLIRLGVKRIVGVEVYDEYVRDANDYICTFYDSVTVIKPEDGCYIPLDSGSGPVDVVIMNEVISHINPMYLDTVLSELIRLLKRGGTAFVSDGNNLAHPGYQSKVHKLFDLWENGPDGSRTDRDIVDKSYLTLRSEIIKARQPQLSNEQVEHLARNTSGLFGSYLEKVIDRYAEAGELVKRPYCFGTCPVYPHASGEGMVMERSFFPQHVEYMFMEKGLDASIVRVKAPQWRAYFQGKQIWKQNIPVRIARLLHNLVRFHFRNVFRPSWVYSASEGFQVRAVKK